MKKKELKEFKDDHSNNDFKFEAGYVPDYVIINLINKRATSLANSFSLYNLQKAQREMKR